MPDHGPPLFKLLQWLVPLPRLLPMKFHLCNTARKASVRGPQSVFIVLPPLHSLPHIASDIDISRQYPRVKYLDTNLQTSHMHQVSFPFFFFFFFESPLSLLVASLSSPSPSLGRVSHLHRISFVYF